MDDGNDTSMEGHRHRTTTHRPAEAGEIQKPVGTLGIPMEDKPKPTPPAPPAPPKRRRYGRWLLLPVGIALGLYGLTVISSGGMSPESQSEARDYWTGHEPWRNGQSAMGMPRHLQEMARNTQIPIDPEAVPNEATETAGTPRPIYPDGTQPEDSSSTAASVQTPEPRDIDPEPQQAWTQGPSLPDRETARNPPAAEPPIQAETQPEAQTDFSRIPSNAHVSVDANGTRISWRITTTLFRAYHAQRHPNPAYPRIRDDIAPSVMTASCRTFDRGSQPPARFGRIRIPADPSARPLPTSDSAFYWFRIVTGYDIKRENIDVAVGSYPAMRTIMALPMIQRDLRPASTVIDIDPLGIFQAFAEGRNVEIVAGNRRTISEIEFQFQESFRPAAVASARLCNAVGWKR